MSNGSWKFSPLQRASCRLMPVIGIFLSIAHLDAGEPSKPPTPELKTATTHPIRYYHFRPCENRSPGSRPAVIICIAGADCAFQGLVRTFQNSSPESFEIVCPCTFSNTNLIQGDLLRRFRQLYSSAVIEEVCGTGLFPDVSRRLKWDEAGLLAILSDLRRGADEKRTVYLTGFSGGGILAYQMAFHHPDKVSAIIAVCANFKFWNKDPHEMQPTATAQAIPVRILTGERDPMRYYRYGGEYLPAPLYMLCLTLGVVGGIQRWIWTTPRYRRFALTASILGVGFFVVIWAGQWSGNEAQSLCAEHRLKSLNYTNVEQVVIPTLSHDPGAKFVFTCVRTLANAN